MQKTTLIGIGEEVGLSGQTLSDFVDFFSLRFPNENERITSYAREWAVRFKSGEPELYMDNLSLDTYKRIQLSVW